MPDVLLAGQQLASLYGKIAKQVDHLVHVLEALPTEPGDGVGDEDGGQGGQGGSSSSSIEKSNTGAGSKGARVGGVGGDVTAARLEQVIRSMVTKQVGEKAGGGAAGSGANSIAGVTAHPAAAAAEPTLLNHLRRLQQGESKSMAGLPAQVAAATGAVGARKASVQPGAAAQPGRVTASLTPQVALLQYLCRSKQGGLNSMAGLVGAAAVVAVVAAAKGNSAF
jgi:hypothetical protein